jgi:SH3 domain protein
MLSFQLKMNEFFPVVEKNPIEMECDVVMRFLKVWFFMVLIGLLILPAVGAAETVYVSENFEVTMRTGPGTDRKIISLVESGKALEMVEKGDEWSMVREPNGKEGWVLNRYLTTNQPCAMVLDQVKQDYDGLNDKYKNLKQNFDQIQAQKKTADADLSQSQQDRDKLSHAYENLKKDSADFLKLKQRYQEMSADLEAEKTRSAKLDEENMQMKRSHIIQWVWTGGGIMLLGFFIGLFSSNRRKSRSSLY